MLKKALPFFALSGSVLGKPQATGEYVLDNVEIPDQAKINIFNAANSILDIINGQNTGTGYRDGIEIVTQSGKATEMNHDLFNIDEQFFISQEEFDEEEGPQRWTHASRPYLKTYSQFRRNLKMMLYGQVKLRPALYAALGPNEPDTRFPKAVNTLPKILRNYGCWCMPRGDRDWANGHGATLDGIDRICKMMGHCQSCTQINVNCYDLLDNKYNSNLKIVDDEDYIGGRKVKLNCKASSGHNEETREQDCLRKQCECQSYYVEQLVKMAIDNLEDQFSNWDGSNILDTDSLIKSEFSQKRKFNGEFDFEDCKRNKDNPERDLITHTPDKCCGNFPEWRLIDSQLGQNECCGSRPYNINQDTCWLKTQRDGDTKLKVGTGCLVVPTGDNCE